MNDNKSQKYLQLGDIYIVKIPQYYYSIQYGIRPCIIAQEEKALNNTDMVWVIPLTSKIKAMHLPHVIIKKDIINGLKYDSVALLESSVKVTKSCLNYKIGRVSRSYLLKLGFATIKQFPLVSYAIDIKTA